MPFDTTRRPIASAAENKKTTFLFYNLRGVDRQVRHPGRQLTGSKIFPSQMGLDGVSLTHYTRSRSIERGCHG
jgi:hypothetical protein